MRKQLISFARVIEVLQNIQLNGVSTPEPPPLRTPLVWKCKYCSAVFALPHCFYNLFVVPFNKKQ